MKNLNLLPTTNKKNNKEKILIKKMITIEVIFFLLLILFVVAAGVTDGIINDKTFLIESSLSNDFSLAKNIKENLELAEIKNKDLNEINKFVSQEKVNVKYYINAISKQIPSNVYISKFNLVSSENFFLLECVSKKSGGFAEFIKQLNNSGLFEEVSLLSIEINNAKYEFFSLEIYYGEKTNE